MQRPAEYSENGSVFRRSNYHRGQNLPVPYRPHFYYQNPTSVPLVSSCQGAMFGYHWQGQYQLQQVAAPMPYYQAFQPRQLRQPRQTSVFRHRPYRNHTVGQAGSHNSSRNYSTSCNAASPSLRSWKHFTGPAPAQTRATLSVSPEVDFRVLSYNILAQCHLEFNPHLYSHVRNPNWLHWPLRRLNLLSDIRCLRADLICLQEMEPDAYRDYFERELDSLGFSGRYLPKTGKALDGCAIFWRRDVFRLEAYTPIEFYRERPQSMAYHNVAQVAVLSLLADPSSRLALANTHLLFNPNRGDAKLLQSVTLLATLARAVPPDTPMILCGDLNAQPNSALFRLFLEGSLSLSDLLMSDISMQNATSFHRRRSQTMLDPAIIGQAGLTLDCQFHQPGSASPRSSPNRHQSPPSTPCPPPMPAQASVLTHRLKFESAYDYRNSEELFTVTSYTAHDSCTVDAIFYNAGRLNSPGSVDQHQQQQHQQLQCLAQLNLLTPRQVDQIGGIPNRLQASDHLPLCAQFRWRYAAASGSGSVPGSGIDQQTTDDEDQPKSDLASKL